ncbi:S8 family serine peptidase [Bordetella bronchialis]|uniref:S8 family serine peptidase n=1 Tax=Bordetella bronchialis TaxID=463025 RepID=UPI003D090338
MISSLVSAPAAPLPPDPTPAPVTAATPASQATDNATLTLESAGRDDPLYPYQWHLKNTGQRVFADTLPTPGIDLNIGTLHREGITGKGVVVAIHEQGRIDPGHEDLAPNLVLGGPVDPARSPAREVAHATATASIIGAVAHNGKGGRGIAPDARLLDMMAPGAHDLPTPILHNASGGNSPVYFAPYDASEYPDTELDSRHGKLFIKSAGNEFERPHKIGIDADACRAATMGTGISCLTATADKINTMANALTVGAVNAAGVKASYSNTGSALWVSGLGGEFGHERQYAEASGANGHTARLVESGAHGRSSRVDDAHLYAPAIVAADTTGVQQGLNREEPGYPRFNALDSASASPIDPSGNYTARANGTSAAAPTVTGVAALVLQANPRLTWRDIKYILATTARKLDPDRQKIVWQGLVLDDGWVTNAAGRAFSNWYGFGLVDATAAVQAARRHTPLGALRNTGWLTTADADVPVSAKDAGAGKSRIAVDGDIKVETVQLRLRTTHKEPGQLHIVLTSPAGTRSIILPAHTMVKLIGADEFSIDLAASNAFLDESARGTWTLQVIDAKDAAPEAAIVSWELRVLGH